jgi:hypothetical protein
MMLSERKIQYEFLHPETKHGAAGNGRKKSRNNCDSTSDQRFTAVTAKGQVAKQEEVETCTYTEKTSFIAKPLLQAQPVARRGLFSRCLTTSYSGNPFSDSF